MNFKQIVLLTIFLMAIQTIVIAIVTRMHKDVFDKFPHATSYARAIAELAKTKPTAALVIKVCYAASIVELMLLVIFKFL